MIETQSLDQINSPEREDTRAIRYNRHSMRKLEAAINEDPEIDLSTRLPPNYSSRLAEIRSPDYTPPGKKIRLSLRRSY
jgi:hypothetical protein